MKLNREEVKATVKRNFRDGKTNGLFHIYNLNDYKGTTYFNKKTKKQEIKPKLFKKLFKKAEKYDVEIAFYKPRPELIIMFSTLHFLKLISFNQEKETTTEIDEWLNKIFDFMEYFEKKYKYIGEYRTLPYYYN